MYFATFFSFGMKSYIVGGAGVRVFDKTVGIRTVGVEQLQKFVPAVEMLVVVTYEAAGAMLSHVDRPSLGGLHSYRQRLGWLQ